MDRKEMTAPVSPVAAGAEQSQSLDKTIIAETTQNCKMPDETFSQMQMEILRMLDPTFLATISMKELYERIFQRKPPIIDGLLNTGTYLFVGAPKLGKSFFMAQLAYHVSTGTPLWEYPERQGTVLYLALEDDYRRLQERLYRMFGTEGTDKLFFSVTANQIGKGLDEQLAGFIGQHPDTSLIIIDTLQKIREMSGDTCSYAGDYEVITKLKRFADKYHICLMLVHHSCNTSESSNSSGGNLSFWKTVPSLPTARITGRVSTHRGGDKVTNRYSIFVKRIPIMSEGVSDLDTP